MDSALPEHISQLPEHISQRAAHSPAARCPTTRRILSARIAGSRPSRANARLGKFRGYLPGIITPMGE
ncbi:hypothetical protein ACFXHA_29275 [Nocardia sp. NPDC059240]|uniref:hypothetical protein n=1 Tax=Nocardia sp. NPDC059240 TaxID=3346786 RepID=UPI00368F8677